MLDEQHPHGTAGGVGTVSYLIALESVIADAGRASCSQLLDLVGAWANDPEVVLLAAPALQAILSTSPFLTAATFAKFDVLAVLAAAAVKQAEAGATQVDRFLMHVR